MRSRSLQVNKVHPLSSKTYTLNTGAKIPAVGLGTWQSKPNEVKIAVEAALKGGYRHIDTAAAYENEKEVGDGIIASGVPRSEIWLTTKLNNPWHKRVTEAFEKSLAALQTDYLDLYLVHWPCSTDPDTGKHYPDWDFVDTWREMQKLLDTGKVKNIGVSNFGIKNMEKLLNAESTKVGYYSLTSSYFEDETHTEYLPDRPRRQPDRAPPMQPLPQADRVPQDQEHPPISLLATRQH